MLNGCKTANAAGRNPKAAVLRSLIALLLKLIKWHHPNLKLAILDDLWGPFQDYSSMILLLISLLQKPVPQTNV